MVAVLELMRVWNRRLSLVWLGVKVELDICLKSQYASAMDGCRHCVCFYSVEFNSEIREHSEQDCLLVTYLNRKCY